MASKKREPRIIKLPASTNTEANEVVTANLPSGQTTEDDGGLISSELKKFELEIQEIQEALSSIKLKDIVNPEEKLKAINAKITAQLKLPSLLSALEELRNKHRIRVDAIKGDKVLSPLEDGLLD